MGGGQLRRYYRSKLFRAENINRHPGSVTPVGSVIWRSAGPGTATEGCNNNYGNLRNWENSVNSNYNALQASGSR